MASRPVSARARTAGEFQAGEGVRTRSMAALAKRTSEEDFAVRPKHRLGARPPPRAPAWLRWPQAACSCWRSRLPSQAGLSLRHSNGLAGINRRLPKRRRRAASRR